MAGRIENSRVGVFLCNAGHKSAALVDRELYLAEEWAADRERRRAAVLPEKIEFAVKPELARRRTKFATGRAGTVTSLWATQCRSLLRARGEKTPNGQGISA
jgi:hypothetical protein